MAMQYNEEDDALVIQPKKRVESTSSSSRMAPQKDARTSSALSSSSSSSSSRSERTSSSASSSSSSSSRHRDSRRTSRSRSPPVQSSSSSSSSRYRDSRRTSRSRSRSPPTSSSSSSRHRDRDASHVRTSSNFSSSHARRSRSPPGSQHPPPSAAAATSISGPSPRIADPSPRYDGGPSPAYNGNSAMAPQYAGPSPVVRGGGGFSGPSPLIRGGGGNSNNREVPERPSSTAPAQPPERPTSTAPTSSQSSSSSSSSALPAFLRDAMRARVAAQVKKSDEIAARRGLPPGALVVGDGTTGSLATDHDNYTAPASSLPVSTAAVVRTRVDSPPPTPLGGGDGGDGGNLDQADDNDTFVGPVRPSSSADDADDDEFGNDGDAFDDAGGAHDGDADRTPPSGTYSPSDRRAPASFLVPSADFASADAEAAASSSSSSSSSSLSSSSLAPAPAPGVRHNPALHGCRNFNACYEVLNSIDEGTYGVVYRAVDRATGETVAVKKVKLHDANNMFAGFPITSLREMSLLLQLRHPNVISVREIAVGNKLSTVYMIMDFEDHDIKALMNAMKEPFQQAEVKCLMRQLLLGIQALHSNWIMHRDLKASNVLYNNQGVLRICDFGMARQFSSPREPYTEVVCTLWYRAPEMLLGTQVYGPEVDMWSVGCLMAEFLTSEALFAGKSEADQIDKIFSLCGTPNEERWPGIEQLRFWRQFRFKKYPNRLRDKFPRSSFAGGAYLGDAGFDLLSRLLEYDPKRRITADEALQHPWFRELPAPRACDQMPAFPSINNADRTEDRRKGIVHTPKLGGGIFG